MRKNVDELLPLNLQFFAEDKEDNEEDNKDSQTDDQNRSTEDDKNSSNNNTNTNKEKTFTQSQVTSMMAKEKNEGKRAILNALGFSNIDDVKKVLENVKENEAKAKEEADKELVNAKNEAEKRASAAENKLACVMAGVNKDSVDDVLSIALGKVTDDKTLTNVLEEMKNVSKYSGFFGTEKESGGTGSDVGHIGEQKKTESMGQRLAKQNATSTKKSSFFN